MSESDGDFAEAYIKLRDTIIELDKSRIKGNLDRWANVTIMECIYMYFLITFTIIQPVFYFRS